MKKILIIGASGYVGNKCYEEFKGKSNYKAIGTQFTSSRKDLKSLDYTKPLDFLNFLVESEPEVILWCGGLKKLSLTEKDYQLSLNQNFHPIKTIIKYQKEFKNCNLIFLSSDYVFDGAKGNYNSTDIPNPSTNYGKAKVLAENYIVKNSTNYSIIRAGAIIGSGSVFFEWIIKGLMKNENLELYDNYFTPTPISNLLEAVKFLIKHPKNSIFHISGKQKLNRFDFGLIIKKHISQSNSRLIKIDHTLDNLNMQKDLSLNISKEFSYFESLDYFLNQIFKS